MKISCQSCAAKYTIADDKVLGKVIKIKCKKCGSTIVVNGNDPAVLAQLQAGGGMAADAAGFDDQAATKLLDQSPFAAGMGAGPDPNEWTVSVTDDDQRTMTTAQIAEEYARGGLSAETFVWREGMGDWAPLTQVAEIMALVQGGSPAAAAPADAGYAAAAGAAAYAAQPAAAYAGQEATAVAPMAAAAPVAAAPVAAAATAAARKAVAARPAGGADLFGGGGGAAAAAASNLPQHVGERNETSVLFSLKDLVAAEASAATGAPKKAPSSKGGAFGGSNDRVDDILSMGSVGAAPMLAPPPLLAPVVEPPPPPPSMAPPASMGGAAMGAAPMMYAQPAPAKRSMGPIIGAAVGGALLVGLVGFFALRGGDDTKADASAKPAETAAPKSGDTSAAKTADPLAASTSTSTADAAKAGDEKAGDEKAGDAKAGDEKAGDTSKTASGDTKTASGDTKALAGTGTTGTTKTTDTKKEEPKKEEPKKEEPTATAAGGDRPFDRGAASAQLGGAAGAAKGCAKPDGPKGSAKVQVTFSPSGKATQATVGPPFAGTSVGSCIAGSFRGLSVPPFTGSAVTVSKTVTIK